MFIVLTAFLLLVSCSSEKPSDLSQAGGQNESASALQAAGTAVPYLLEITNTDINRRSAIQLKTDGFNLSSAKFDWLVNGKPVAGASSHLVLPAGIKKGDALQAKATIEGKEIISNSVTVSNTPPEISQIRFMPEVFKAGDNLYVDVTGSDADGDTVTILYEWSKNNEPAGNDKKIAGTLKRGDKISIKVTPFDGTEYGKSAFINREIINMPPLITDDRKFTFDGRTYKYQVKASDPDDDTLTYSLKTSPQGMTINPSTGLVQWNVPPDFTGKAAFTVAVTDGQGGQAVYELAVTIKP